MLAADASLANRAGGPHGWPPLLYLAFSRVNSTRPGNSTLEVARLLLAHGADANAGYLCDGEPPPVTALSGAFRGRLDPVNQPAHQYSLPLARLLLDAGADPNDPQRWTTPATGRTTTRTCRCCSATASAAARVGRGGPGSATANPPRRSWC